MKKYFAPLGVFVAGQFVALLAFLFLNSVGNAASTLATQTAAYNSTFWNWSWVVGNTKFLLFFFIEVATIFCVFVALVKNKS